MKDNILRKTETVTSSLICVRFLLDWNVIKCIEGCRRYQGNRQTEYNDVNND